MLDKKINFANCYLSWVIALIVFSCTGSLLAQSSSQRVLFLGPEAPEMLEFEVSTGRFSIDATRQKYAEGLLSILDQDQDGKLTAPEAEKVPREGRLRSNSTVLGSDWKKYDQNPADDSLSVEELRIHLDEALGAPISIERAPARLDQTVRLYADIDTDANGKITTEEVKNGLNALQMFDFDDDEALSVAELQPFPNSVLQAQMEAQSEDDPLPLILVNTDDQRLIAARRCVHQYGDGKSIGPELMTKLAGRQARRFDRDRDQKWNEQEVAESFVRIPAQIRLSVSLAPPVIRLLSDPSNRDTRHTLDLGGVPVEMQSANMRWMVSNYVGLLKTTRFANADTDGNKYLNEQEFVGLQAGEVDFASVDLDGNGEVTRDEIGKFFTLDNLATQTRVVLSLSDEGTTLFKILDTNDDRRLQPREFREGQENLLKFDHNQDQALALGELATRSGITFTQPQIFRFDPRENMDDPGSRVANVSESGSGPVWFQRMDRNLDQEISWREFLGSREDFEALDENKNGYLESSEAQRAEQLR